MLKEIIKYFFGKKSSEYDILKQTFDVWDYRLKNGGSHYGVEWLFQVILSKYYIELSKDSLILISESLRKVVEDNENYPEKSVFKTDNNRYIQPDLCVVKKNNIKEIIGIKSILGSCYSWIFSKNGSIKKFDGDIFRLKNIKIRYPKIDCYQLVVKRMDFTERDWGEDLLYEMLQKDCLRLEVVVAFNQQIRVELYSVMENSLLSEYLETKKFLNAHKDNNFKNI
ncbi:hypothetical protein FHQ18_00570 [Deferribacter autotrophicus]|uniref:Restriction endonuclease n=1 Tax=Deferribacter autotrophicus TaxID=500465 RepID=A0A5A8F6W5_9BACT|nr:hypothetical protein [Deferribacter autotrophicus]KAA0259405.1 hypothetical protein FHQ18_00570 [Deferribacter autotrophicus]